MADTALPQVWLCMATSLDGKLNDGRPGAPSFTSRYDRNKLFRLRADVDALLVGAGTVRHENLPPLIRDPDLLQGRDPNNAHPDVAIVSNSLNLPWDSDYFAKRRQRMLILTSSDSEEKRQKVLEMGLDWVHLGPSTSLTEGLRQLFAKGYRRILAEGGGGMVHALLKEGLVDRFFLTIAPVVLGGGDQAPDLANGPALEPPAHFELISQHVHAGELHLVYQRP